MAATRRSELIAGIFVLACAAATFAVAVWLGGVRFGGSFAHVTAPLAVGDVSIVPGSEVKLGVIAVGKVDQVVHSPDWRRFTFRIRLDHDVDLRSDAVIEAVAPALGGVGSLVVLDPGSRAAPPADAEHPAILRIGPNPMIRDLQHQLGYGPHQRETLQAAIENVGVILGDLAPITAALRGQLVAADEPNLMDAAAETLETLRDVAVDLRGALAAFESQLDADNVEGAMGKVHRTLDGAAASAEQMAGMMATIRPDVERSTARVAAATEAIERYARDDLADLLTTLRAGGNELLGVMGELRELSTEAGRVVTLNTDRIDEMVANLSQVSVNLKATSRDVRRHPWKLLRRPDAADARSENIRNAAEAFAFGAAQLDGAIGRLRRLRELEADGRIPDDPTLELIRREIGDSFEHFIRVERALWDELAN